MRCGDCGFGVSGITITRKLSQKGYECSQYRTYGKSRCKCHEIKEIDMIVHLKQFLNYTKKEYLREINKIKIDIKPNNKQKSKEKIKLEIACLNAEYRVLINQKIKDISIATNEYQKQLIEDTYKDLEKEKIKKIENLKKLMQKEETEILKEKTKALKTAIEYFNDIISKDIPNRFLLENLIDTIWIYHDKTVRFDLKVDIKK